MIKYNLFIVIFLCVISLSSYGQENESTYPIDQSYRVCVDSNGSTLGMLECISIATKQWDKELNKYYNLLFVKLSQLQQKSLRESQLQWLTYRDKETKFYLDVYTKREGTMWNVVIARRRMDIIRQRANELMEYYDTITQN